MLNEESEKFRENWLESVFRNRRLNSPRDSSSASDDTDPSRRAKLHESKGHVLIRDFKCLTGAVSLRYVAETLEKEKKVKIFAHKTIMFMLKFLE